METLLSLRTAVVLAIQDTSFSDIYIDGVLNRGLLEIAGGATRDFSVPTLPPLPNLQTEFSIDTVVGQNSVDMPVTYQRGGLQGFDETGNALGYHDSLIKFHKNFRSETSAHVTDYCIVGNTIHYYGSPSSITPFYIEGFAFPAVMAQDSATPDCLPAHLQYRLLFNYACMEIYALIEQDSRMAGNNHETYKLAYGTALTDLFSIVEKDEETSYISIER